MDPISAGIIITVLSAGTLLVYVFISDYQKRQQRTEKQPKQVANVVKSPNKTRQAKATDSASKKKAFEQTLPSTKHINVMAPTPSDIAGLVEPSLDELDASIPVHAFVPALKTEKKTVQRPNEKSNKNQRNKRQNALVGEPSSEQLFDLITSCTLSKEEIELAIENLLNKSSDADWKPSKSDPLYKVRNQLEQVKSDLSKQQTIVQKRDNQLHKAELNNKILSEKVNDLEAKLKTETEEKIKLLRGCELTSKKIGEQIHDFEDKLRKTESEAKSMRSACNDAHNRLKEVLETNSMLEKSLNELQLINSRQEEMLIRLRKERHVNEASMKRTLCEMEEELRELQGKLSVSSANQNEQLRREFNSAEREGRLILEMKELREGLSALLPDIKTGDAQTENDNWVHQYLGAVKHLSKTVEELRDTNRNIINNNNVICPDSPSKQLVDKSTLTPIHRNGVNSRVNSPTSNGRASKAGSNKVDYDSSDKKAMETKLLEPDYDELLRQRDKYVEKVRELALVKNKLEAQVKFGLDSLKMEQQHSRSLEQELARLEASAH